MVGIFSTAVLVFVFFFLPETQYYRPSKAQSPDASSQSLAPEDEAIPPKESTSSFVEENQPVALPAKKTYLQDLNPWSGLFPGGQKGSFFSIVFRSWPLVTYPAVFYCTLVSAMTISVLLCVVDTVAAVFQSPPYNMSPGIQSLILLPLMVGGIIGSLVGGYGTDIYCKYKASKNNGIFEPENRLVMIILPALFTTAGVFMYGFLAKSADGGIGMDGVLQTSHPGHCRGSEV
jgi:hypothetical protein